MKKSIIAILIAIMMLASMIPASAEVFAGEGETVPERIEVPMANAAIVIDGVLEADFWGEPFIIANGISRAENDTYINPKDGTYLDNEDAPNANSEFFFRWDKDYLYIATRVANVYDSNVDASALWVDGVDIIQVYLGIDDGDAEGTNDPHLGFGINANADCSESYINVFEQNMPDAADGATVADAMLYAVGADGLYTVYEMAVPISDGLGYAGEAGEEIFFSGSFFFGSTYAYQVGPGVFWANKWPTDCPVLALSDKVVEVAAEEEVVEEVEVVEEEELVEVTEEVEEVEEVEVAPAPETTTTNPTTADISVIFYALAAISAIGGVSVFKRK